MKTCLRVLLLLAAACAASSMTRGASAASVSGQTLLQYGQQCADEISAIPAFDCNAGTTVPITVNNRVPERYFANMTCDRPALLPYESPTSGPCTPYSKILNLSHGTTEISAFCRRKIIRPVESPYYDEVDVVLHDTGNGKTCWFHAEHPGSAAGMDASRVPPPNEVTPPPGHVAAEKFWWPPAATATKKCVSCHDASPVMYSPWLGQVWDKVPTDPWGKYVNIGDAFAAWTSISISTPGNTCVGCHRIGNQHSCDIYVPLAAGRLPPPKGSDTLASSYPLNHWMPVNNNKSEAQWDAASVDSVNHLLTCCTEQGKRDPACQFVPNARGGK